MLMSAAASLINAAPEHSAIPHDRSPQLPTLQDNHTCETGGFTTP